MYKYPHPNAIFIDCLTSSGADRLSLYDLNHNHSDTKCLLKSSKWANGKGKVHKYGVTAVKWYPFDSGMFISGSLDGTVHLWDTNTFSSVLKFNLKKKVFGLSMNRSLANQPVIAVASDQFNIYLCDVLSHSFTHSLIGHSDIVRCVAFNPFNEYLIASGSADHCIRIWDIRKAGCLLVCDSTNLHDTAMHCEYLNVEDELRIHRKHSNIQSHGGTVAHLEWSNQHKFHLYSSGTDKVIRKWRVNVPDDSQSKNRRNAKRKRDCFVRNELVHYRPVRNHNLCQRFVVSENDEMLFYPNNCDLSMFSTNDGRELGRFKGHFSCIYAVTERRKYQQIVTGDIHGNILIFSPKRNEEPESCESNFARLKRVPTMDLGFDHFDFNEIDQDNWSE